MFVADPSTMNEEKEKGWRGGTTKVCLTHLKDEHGVLVLAPPTLTARQPVRRLPGLITDSGKLEAVSFNGNGTASAVVTWDDLVAAHQDGDINRLATIARQLKSDNERLKGKVIEAQDRLLATLE